MIRDLLNNEAVRAVYGAVISVLIALVVTGVIDQGVVDTAIEVGVVLGLGEFTRQKVYSQKTVDQIKNSA